MKGIFVVLEGVADEPCQSLGHITPLQAAKTPNLDHLAKKSRIDYCYPVKEGAVPESSSAIVSLLGYDSNFAPRGPLEASGAGIKIARGDLAVRTNFGTIDGLSNKNLLDRRAGRTLTGKETQILAKAINEKVKLPFKFEFYPTLHHRGVLVFRGGFSDNITNIDQSYGRGVANLNSTGKVIFSKPMDDEDDSKLAADLLNRFARESHEVLDKHPLNFNRAKKGMYSANFILCRDAGNEPIQFKKLRGRWRALVYAPLEIGIAQAAKMDVFKFSYPKMKGTDVYSNLYSGLRKAIKHAIKMIKKSKDKYDYFYVHFKETDVPGHDNRPLDKVKMIELIDKRFLSYLRRCVEKSGSKLVITADHITSCRLKSHSSGPVPVLFYSPEDVEEQEQRFTEEQGMKGRKIMGRKLLEKTLFSK
ncbi:MAG: hypothetical protein IIA87_00615 [Nanoarchaeota archaeon]|nr:hypothetical protein [Nanoarchaeota archaeon]